jgi:AcrR family transcriptional regulator
MPTKIAPRPTRSRTRRPVTKSAAPRWQRRKDERPSELIDAALAVFAERGYAATRLEDVAHHAGVTKGTMYLYFENKEALFKELVRSRTLPLVESVEELVRTHRGSARDLVVQILRRRWEAIVDSPLSGIPKLMMSEAGNFPELSRWYHDEVISRANGALARAIELGVERGEFRPVEPRRTASLAVAPLLVAAIWKHSFSRCVSLPFDFDGFLEGHLEIFLRGLERRAADEVARA